MKHASIGFLIPGLKIALDQELEVLCATEPHPCNGFGAAALRLGSGSLLCFRSVPSLTDTMGMWNQELEKLLRVPFKVRHIAYEDDLLAVVTDTMVFLYCWESVQGWIRTARHDLPEFEEGIHHISFTKSLDGEECERNIVFHLGDDGQIQRELAWAPEVVPV